MADSTEPFAAASELVAGMEASYKDLKIQLPKLESLKKELTKEVADLNVQVIAAEDRLSKLNETIGKNTAAYNEWQRSELERLEAKKAAVKKQLNDYEHSLTDKSKRLDELSEQLESGKAQLASQRARITEDRKDLQAQSNISDKRTASLNAREIELRNEQGELNIDRKNVSDAQTLAEKSIKEIEAQRKLVDDLVKETERDRESARVLLANTKDQIATVDMREKAADKRDQDLSKREQELDTLKRALDDRRDVMISNGTLRPSL